MYEEFETEHYRVTNPIHGTPQVYSRSGKLLGELEPDGELAYVTEWKGYLITEYLALDGQRYARLLDGSLRVLADLPDLCDILPTDGRRSDETLVFDDMAGSLRETHIRTLDELMELARERRN